MRQKDTKKGFWCLFFYIKRARIDSFTYICYLFSIKLNYQQIKWKR